MKVQDYPKEFLYLIINDILHSLEDEKKIIIKDVIAAFNLDLSIEEALNEPVFDDKIYYPNLYYTNLHYCLGVEGWGFASDEIRIASNKVFRFMWGKKDYFLTYKGPKLFPSAEMWEKMKGFIEAYYRIVGLVSGKNIRKHHYIQNELSGMSDVGREVNEYCLKVRLCGLYQEEHREVADDSKSLKNLTESQLKKLLDDIVHHKYSFEERYAMNFKEIDIPSPSRFKEEINKELDYLAELKVKAELEIKRQNELV